MNTFALHNKKGGTGKTLLAVHLAFLLAEQGKRVAYIDLDTQANGTRFFGASAPFPASRLFGGELRWPATTAGSVLLVPGDPGGLAAVISNQRVEALKSLAHALEQAEASGLDAVVIDTPPTKLLIGDAAVALANLVVIPCEPHPTSLAGASQVVKEIESYRSQINTLIDYRVVINRLSAVAPKQKSYVIEMAKRFGNKLVPVALNERDAYKRVDDYGVPVWDVPKLQRNKTAIAEMYEMLLSLPGVANEV